MQGTSEYQSRNRVLPGTEHFLITITEKYSKVDNRLEIKIKLKGTIIDRLWIGIKIK